MYNLYDKIYEAINDSIQKALIIDDSQNQDVSVKFHEKEITNKFVPYEYQMVDLDLPSGLLWSEYNLGAFPGNKVENWYGKYYAWGETRSKKIYMWETYDHCNCSYNTLLKYNVNSNYGDVIDNKAQLETEDDIVSNTLGMQYRIPTLTDFKELLENTIKKRVKDYNGIVGLNGLILKSKINGKALFFPCAGFYSGYDHKDEGIGGLFCTATLCEQFPYYAEIFYFNNKTIGTTEYDRCGGRSVRYVTKTV